MSSCTNEKVMRRAIKLLEAINRNARTVDANFSCLLDCCVEPIDATINNS